ncbi:glucose-6-phosphatase 2 [Lutzomyia longipalpis]|uniref:glucose-6-phosphatase 2 n=1 Tax=Lutzomyia longipalpis TaxID=7200 RepID=UPI002483C6A3|nr:glucose-6-phosphatase 2 [Lutzomyia longipalpis]
MNCKIYEYEISHNLFLQKNFHSYSNVFLFTNKCLSVSVFFNFFLPLLAGVDKDIFLRATISGLIADYVNSLSKWVLAEPRPHWWARGEHRRLRLEQYDGTCECTPGSPSSEAMVTAAVLFVVLSGLIERFQHQITPCWKKFIWMTYVLLLMLQMISQLFLGVHFLHQCLLGSITGAIIGSFLSSPRIFEEICKISKLKSCSLIVGIFLIICGSYWIQDHYGVDPNWSTRLAFLYCENANAINPEYLIMYFLMRNLGIFIGILSFAPLNYCRPFISNSCTSATTNIGKMIIGSILMRYIPRHFGVYNFYGLTVAFYAIYYFILYKNFR